jgi:hypothetical protein
VKFNVTLDRGENGTGVVECPAIPGSVNHGETKQEALAILTRIAGRMNSSDVLLLSTLLSQYCNKKKFAQAGHRWFSPCLVRFALASVLLVACALVKQQVQNNS